MTLSFTPSVNPPTLFHEPVYWFVFRGYLLLVAGDEEHITIPLVQDVTQLDMIPKHQLYLGCLGDTHCFAVEVEKDTQPPAGMSFKHLRKLYNLLPYDLFSVGMRTVQIIDWNRHNQFCGQCGMPMETQPHERAKICPNCKLVRYPRISPAIIVAVVKDGDKLLLARSPRHPPGLYSVLAGFVEPGETLEETVVREVKEETNIDVKDIQYFGSQPWPFPDSLMVAFTAKYAGGEIVIEEPEIEEAGWFDAGNLPVIPSSISISRQLIDWFIEQAS